MYAIAVAALAAGTVAYASADLDSESWLWAWWALCLGWLVAIVLGIVLLLGRAGRKTHGDSA